MSQSLARRIAAAAALLTAAAVSIGTSAPDTLGAETAGQVELTPEQPVATRELRLALVLDDADDVDDVEGWLNLSFGVQMTALDGGSAMPDPAARVEVVVRRAGDTGAPLFQGELWPSNRTSHEVLRGCRARTCEETLVLELRRLGGTGAVPVAWDGNVHTQLDPEAGTLELVVTP